MSLPLPTAMVRTLSATHADSKTSRTPAPTCSCHCGLTRCDKCMQTLRQATQEISMHHFNRVLQSSLLVSAIPLQKNQRRPHRTKLTRNFCDNRIITLQPRLRLSNICNIVPLMLILHKARHQIGVLTGSKFNMTITIFLLSHKVPHQSNTNRQIHTMQADKQPSYADHIRGPVHFAIVNRI